MTTIRFTRRALVAGLFLAPLALGSTGCTPNALGFLFRGDGKKPATYPLKPLKNRDSKEVRVVVFASTAPGLSYEFASADRDVSQQMAKKLAEGTKDEKHPIKIIRPEDVERFKLSNPTWKVMHPCRVAQQLNADYMIDVSITGIGLYQPGSGNVVYEGWATADVTVYETGIETPVYQYFHQSKQRPQAADGMPAGQYKAYLMKQFSYELASRHMKHTEDSRVAPLEMN